MIWKQSVYHLSIKMIFGGKIWFGKNKTRLNNRKRHGQKDVLSTPTLLHGQKNSKLNSNDEKIPYCWIFFLSVQTFQVLKTWKACLRAKMFSSMIKFNT